MQSISILSKFVAFYLISFYSLSVKKIDSNNTIAFSSFVGKKVLVVNAAINTADTIQYRKLEQLHQKYKDSLVIIVFPSNTFGNTAMNDNAIKNFIISNYDAHYLIATKTKVRGNNISPVYSWLATMAKNGMMDSQIRNDFNKYLIDKNGKLVGFFGRSEDPMGINIKNAIENGY
jgi:glutathione peroxidase